ncbi:hypothetical protein C4J81_08990 [Deltaproteobacteria bacterium Smac51]|nr:hypothetical protein C4J81_08990 [Deltaproteobacteria bacterium Smac51]
MSRLLASLLIAVLLPAASAFSAEPKVIHVLVALCDNEIQGIVPVPPAIGNGDDPANNLYWGALYGVSTHLKKQKGWRLEKRIPNPTGEILERLIFRSAAGENYLIADAYAGRHIKRTNEDLFNFAAGQATVEVELENMALKGGGEADLLVYMGHNGLMDFALEKYPVAVERGTDLASLPANVRPVTYDGKKRDVVVFSCLSERFYKELISLTGASPLIMTKDLMAPEAYILAALADGWLADENPEQIRERVAEAYNKYQKCGLKAARRTFAARQ